MQINTIIKKRNQLLKVEIDKRCKEKLCFKCRLLGHQSKSHYNNTKNRKKTKGRRQRVNAIKKVETINIVTKDEIIQTLEEIKPSIVLQVREYLNEVYNAIDVKNAYY